MMSSYVFVDSRVQDYVTLLAGLAPDTEVIVLDSMQDGVTQIAHALEGVTDLDAIHIISHGSEGTLYLGDTVLTSDNLTHYTSELEAIGAALTSTGDILLYGCEVANGITGRSFIGDLALYTGADVAASTDYTGSKVKGGDWVLELSTGTIEAEALLDSSTLISYSSTLAVTNLLSPGAAEVAAANLISAISFVNTYNGGLGYWGAYHPQISHDGTFVAFDTVPAAPGGYSGAQLPPFIDIGGTLQSSGAEHVYLKNLATGALDYLDPVVIGDFGLDYSPGGDSTSISADGRYVAYQVPGFYDSGLPSSGANVDQVNIIDASTGIIVNPNANANGTPGNGDSGSGTLSTTGRYVVFRSSSTDLVANDTNGVSDVFLKDTVTGAVSLVSAESNGTPGNGASGFQHQPSVSSNGRYVLFETSATNLGGPASAVDILIKDMQTGTLMDMGAANLFSKNASMTPDGRYVVFEIDPFDSYGQVYRFDTVTQTTVLVSTGTNGAGNDDSKAASISADGRFVAFESNASNFVANDTNGATFSTDIFVKDLSIGSITRLSVSAVGAEANGYSLGTRISGDGHYIVFQSYASNLIAGDNNTNPDAFIVINPFWVPPPPDLTVTDLSFNGVTIAYSINALDTAVTLTSTAGIYLSTDGTVTTSDTLLGTRVTPSIVANGSYADNTSVVFPSNFAPGTYYLGVVADYNSQITESNEANNASNAAPIILGNNSDNTLTGTSGNNTILGLGGNDTLNGGSGSDVMAGGSGNDTYIVNAAGDVVIENAGAGTDSVQSSVTHTLTANVEHLTLTGVGNASGNGNSLANSLTGNSGNNTLNGGLGNDTLVGGAGNDTYVVNAAGDVVTEAAAAGTDLVQASTSHTLGANVENLTLTGTGHSSGNGNTLNNILTGNVGNNNLNGGTGNDTMVGGAGNDSYSVNAAGDVVTEGAGAGTDSVSASLSYTLGANVENLMLTGAGNAIGTGNTLNNKITGNSGNNTLSGNDGADTLSGGTGNDTLTGGTGIDVFDYNALTDAADGITDFTAGAGGDKIDIDTLMMVLGYNGADPLAAGYVQLLQAGAHTQVNIDSNGGGDSFATTLVTLQNVTAGNVTLADNFMV